MSLMSAVHCSSVVVLPFKKSVHSVSMSSSMTQVTSSICKSYGIDLTVYKYVESKKTGKLNQLVNMSFFGSGILFHRDENIEDE